MDDGRHSPPMVKNATVHPGLELPCKIELLCLCLRGKKEAVRYNQSTRIAPVGVTSQLCQTDKVLLEACRIMNSLKSNKKCKSGTNKGADIETGCCPHLGGMGWTLLSPLAPAIITAGGFLYLENHAVTLQCLF